jgi:hypothetical protein
VEHASTRDKAKDDPDEGYRREYQRAKYNTWREGLETYLGVDPEARRTGGRFDLPPYQIRIKSRATDSELPNLDFDVDKREISFEWEGMFARFFYELAVLESVQQSIMAESTLWLSERVRTLGSALSHKKKRWQALCNATKRIRRHRVRRWYIENHGWDPKDSLFDDEEEDRALNATREFELYDDFERCAEDTESREKAEACVESQEMLGRWGQPWG